MANATKREAELELLLWRDRAETVKIQAANLNMQAQLLQLQSKECADNITRCEAELKAFDTPAEGQPKPVVADTAAPPPAGGGPGEEQH